MSALHLRLNGTDLMADLSGALYWAAGRTLVVADLHFEKGTALARRGALLPPYDSHATLARLAAAMRRYRPARVLCLGDSFHDAGAADRLPPAAQVHLADMVRSHEWLWIEGNHDPEPPAAFGGRAAAEVRLGPLVFRHQGATAAEGISAGEVSGHFHPKASLTVRGRYISRRCFATDGRRLVLPSFGAYTGGLDVTDAAIGALFSHPFAVHVLGHGRLHSLSSARLMPAPQAGRTPIPTRQKA